MKSKFHTMPIPTRYALGWRFFGFLVLMAAPASVFAWMPPIGIPTPEFGIVESVSDQTFTHWVDNSNPSCSDGSDGTPSSPRCSVPKLLEAGDVVQIRGGPYSAGTVTWTAIGTPANPVFIRGPADGDKIVFEGNSDIDFQGTYGILENVDLPRLTFQGGGATHHLSLRHSHVHDHPGTGSMTRVSSDTSNIVIWDNEINNNGVIPSPADHHGINIGSLADRIWIVDNHIHHNSGDGVQFCHSCNSGEAPSNIFIGRNHMHDDEENAMDFKGFNGPVIVSQNVIHGYRTGQYSGNGDAIRINDEGQQGDIWVIYNEIFDSRMGINPSGAAAQIRLIGNVIHDIINGPAISWDADIVVNNTIYDINGDAIRGGEAQNNIIVNVSGEAIGDEVTNCSNNLITAGTLSVSCTNGENSDPLLLIDAENSAYGIGANSPAIDNGVIDHPTYADFENTYGLSIRFDHNGDLRLQGSGWDIGAHEFGSDSGMPRPSPPTDLTISGM